AYFSQEIRYSRSRRRPFRPPILLEEPLPPSTQHIVIEASASVNMKLPTGQDFLIKGFLIKRTNCASILKPWRRIWRIGRLFRVRISALGGEKIFPKIRLPFGAKHGGRRVEGVGDESGGFSAASPVCFNRF